MDSYYGEPCQFLPIDFAIQSDNAEAVEILAPHTKGEFIKFSGIESVGLRINQ